MKESEKELAAYLSKHKYTVECIDDLEVYTDLLKRYSKETIEAYLDFVDADLGILFARKLESLSDTQRLSIKEILNRMN